MKKVFLAAGLMMFAGVTLAAGKPCEELKSEIASKLDAKGVQRYTLDVVDRSDPAGKEVGTCEGGTKKIVYTRH